MAILTLRPNSDIQTSSYTKSPSSQANFYSLVNEASQDGDTTYLYTNSASAVLTLGSELPEKNANTISRITMYAVCAVDITFGFNTDDSGYIGFNLNGETHNTSVTVSGTGYDVYSYEYTPTSTLTFQDINSLEFRFGQFTDNDNKLHVKCTQMYIDIEYEEAVVVTNYNVSVNATHVTHSLPLTIESNAILLGTFTPDTGYRLPNTITVLMGGQPTSDYIYDTQNGDFSIESVTGDVEISIFGEIIVYSVETSLSNVTIQGLSNSVDYGGSLSGTFVANEGYTLPNSISVLMGNQPISNYTYNSQNGQFSLNNVTGNISISAEGVPIQYTVSTNLQHTTVQDLPNTVEYGGSISGTFIADTGYKLPDEIVVLMNDSEVPSSNYQYDNLNGQFSMNDITGNIDIEVISIIAQYSVTTELLYLTVQNLPSTVEYGGSITGIFVPNEGFELPESITVEMGEEVLGSDSYTYSSSNGQFELDNITGNVKISATAIAEAGFTVALNLTHTTSSGFPVSVNYGDSISGTFIPEEGYKLPENITVQKDNSTVSDTNYQYNSSNGSFTMNNIDGNISITVVSEIQRFLITTNAGPNGTITPSSTVEYGGSITVNISANSGYDIENVIVDGESKGSISSYAFNNVRENHTISATFTRQDIPVVSGDVIVRIDKDMNVLLRGEIIEGNNTRIDKNGNLYIEEIIENNSIISLDKDMNLDISEIKEAQYFGSN